MDKSTLSNYGWVVIVTLVLSVMLAFATPFGSYVARATANVVKYYKTVTGDTFSADYIEGQSEEWDYYLTEGVNENGMVTRESDFVLMDFYNMGDDETPNPKQFSQWAVNAKKVVFENNFSKNFNIVNDTSYVTPNSNYALDVSDAQDGCVVAYLTQANSEITLHIAGKNNVVMANRRSIGLFRGMSNVESINFNNCLNTINATNFSRMFKDCINLKSLDLTNFNTTGTNDMMYMFGSCESLTKINISNFDTSNVRNMSYMFVSCKSLKNIDTRNLDVSQCVTMTSMFAFCESLQSLDLSSWNPQKMSTIVCGFYGCKSIKELDLSNWHTDSLVYSSDTFSMMTSLKVLHLNNWDTSKVTNAKCMFLGSDKLEHIYVGEKWNIANDEYLNMYSGCGVSDVEFL